MEDPGLTYAGAAALAKERGGRLCTNEEVIAFLMGNSLMPKEDQWVATVQKDGKTRDWVQIGDKYHTPGTQHRVKWGVYPVWGDDVENDTFGKIVWNRIVMWKKDEVEAVAA